MTSFLILCLCFFGLYSPAEPASTTLLPIDQSLNVSLYPLIQWVEYNGEDAICQLIDSQDHIIEGSIEIQDNYLTFYPYQLLEPSTTYQFLVTTPNTSYHSQFTTTDIPMPDRWVEVILGDIQKVLVWEDQQISHVFPCSGGTDETPSILGLYSMINRGNNFYSERVGEGANYWIRIRGNYLFHGIVRNKNGEPIPGEAEKLGTAASHGCIRLSDTNARWLYENMPDGTVVVIHPGSILPVSTN